MTAQLPHIPGTSTTLTDSAPFDPRSREEHLEEMPASFSVVWPRTIIPCPKLGPRVLRSSILVSLAQTNR